MALKPGGIRIDEQRARKHGVPGKLCDHAHGERISRIGATWQSCT